MYSDERHQKDNPAEGEARQGRQKRKHHNNDKQRISRLDLIQYNEQILFVAKKAEKLTTALYMITDFLNYKEPFKWGIREKAVHFLSLITLFSSASSATKKEHIIMDILPILSETMSLLRLGLSIRLISHMNYSILQSEYSTLYDILHAQLSTQSIVDNFSLSKDLFEVSSALDKGQNKRHYNKGQKASENVLYNNTEQGTAREDVISHQSPNNNSNNVPLTGKKGARRDMILKVIRTRGEANIKDISEIISECGEKTIQRELMSLIRLGRVRRIGERRWSRYTI